MLLERQSHTTNTAGQFLLLYVAGQQCCRLIVVLGGCHVKGGKVTNATGNLCRCFHCFCVLVLIVAVVVVVAVTNLLVFCHFSIAFAIVVVVVGWLIEAVLAIIVLLLSLSNSRMYLCWPVFVFVVDVVFYWWRSMKLEHVVRTDICTHTRVHRFFSSWVHFRCKWK